MTKRQIHLAVFVHGAKGSAKDVTAPAALLEEAYPDQILTLLSTANEGNMMYDGIDICGCRLAQEVYDHVVKLQDTCSVTKFSIFGYSMGGVISRFAIGLLDNINFFDNIELMNFVSFASPHLSIHHPYDSLLAKALNFGMKFVYCPLVQQFSFQDNSHDHKPVYKILADPGYVFIKTLGKFKYRRLYLNATGDGIIPYFSGAIDKRGLFDSFPKMKMMFHSKYPCIIRDFDDAKENDVNRPASHDNPRYFFFMLLFLPIFATWVGIPAYYRYYKDRKRFKKGDDGFWRIKERGTEVSKKANRDEKLTGKVKQSDATWNPLPGRHLSSKKNCMKLHPVQKFMYNNLTQLKFDRALVHLKTKEAHIAIIGIKGTEHHAAPLFKHYVSTFEV